MLATQIGHAETISCLLDYHAKTKLRAKDGKTALMLATQIGHAETISCLLDYHAKTKLRAKDGKTALMLAGEKDFSSLEPLLMQNSMLAKEESDPKDFGDQITCNLCEKIAKAFDVAKPFLEILLAIVLTIAVVGGFFYGLYLLGRFMIGAESLALAS